MNLTEFSHKDAAAAGHALALDLSRALRAAIELRGTATLVVPGGRSAKLVLPVLFDDDLPWQHARIVLTDERLVPVTSIHSNARLIMGMMRGRRAARALFDGLVQRAGRTIAPARHPFDAVLAGIGDDGHTASVFPGRRTPDQGRDVIATWSPRAPYARLSLTIDSLADTRHLFLLQYGEAKRRALTSALKSMSALPLAQLLRKCRGSVSLYADRPARF